MYAHVPSKEDPFTISPLKCHKTHATVEVKHDLDDFFFFLDDGNPATPSQPETFLGGHIVLEVSMGEIWGLFVEGFITQNSLPWNVILASQHEYFQGFRRVMTRSAGWVRRFPQYRGSSRVGSGCARNLTGRVGSGRVRRLSNLTGRPGPIRSARNGLTREKP